VAIPDYFRRVRDRIAPPEDVGDMRRLISHYARNSETVFPTGPYVYGTDVSLPIPAAEENNPQYAVAPHCIKRSAAFQ
jgi:hypothetical protein